MGDKIQLDKESKAVLLFNKQRDNWEDRTMSIAAMYTSYYYGKLTGYDIYFKNTGKKLFYKNEKVKFLSKVCDINIEKQDVYVDGVLVTAFKVDQFEKGYFRVYVDKDTTLTKNIELKNNKHKDIFTYFCKLAGYAETIAEEQSPLYYLARNYRRISLPSTDSPSVLIDYLQGVCKPVVEPGLMLLPFDFNQSQIKAIDAALKNKISIIEGPPGTGKTQTILNLITSIIYQGKNCAVVSNNNTAINNIFEKLGGEKLSFIAATLGSQANVKAFFESDPNGESSHFLERKIEPVTSQEHSRITELCVQMKKIQETEVETSILQSQLIELQHEKRHFDNISDETLFINQKLSSKDYMEFITRIEKPKKLWFIERWLLGRKFKVRIALHDANVLLRNAERLYYKAKIDELSKKIEDNKEFLENHKQEQVCKELKSLYQLVLNNFLKCHYQNLKEKEFSRDTYKFDYDNFTKRYPVVLSTSQSLLNNVGKLFTFDYLIIDEASQGDLLSSLLAMSCAENLVVVGDSRQLQQIDEEQLFQESEKLAIEYEIPQPYRYKSNSILKSIKEAVPGAPTTLLREHYRCAPDIINFCDKMFYNGELLAMTANSGKHIEIIKTVPGNHARRNPNGSGLYNLREIDEIGNTLKESASESIGIISPFRHQANLISSKFVEDRVEADTIHKFQGRQKDEIILSFVVNSLDNDSHAVENRLNDFVTNDKLLNVAISRGRTKVTAIVADKVYHSTNNTISDFIKYSEYIYGSEMTRESKVTSVFDVLYSEYTTLLLLKFKGQPKAHKTELLMCDVINEVLKCYAYIGYSMHTRLGKLVHIPDTFSDEERSYILHPWTHVDFLFYNRVSKEKLFVLEVDGIRYHEQVKKQAAHDDIKNQILSANNIPIFRFRTNESNEKQRLVEILAKYKR